MASEAMNRDSFIRTAAELVAGLQVPLSLGVPLGAADRPLRELLDAGRDFGWTDADQLEVAYRRVIEGDSNGE